MRVTIGIVLCSFAALVAVAPPAAQEDAAPLLRAHKAELIADLTDGLARIYVFPDVAEEMNRRIRDKLDRGEYDGLETLAQFTQQLTEDLQSISHDKHLRVVPAEPPLADDVTPAERAAERERLRAADRFANYGFRRVELLPGNIGYLDLRGFFNADTGGATAVAAMGFLAHSSALIVDLRNNGGGSPSMIQLLSSYFFDEPQHLNTFYIRESDSYKQFWTQAAVAGTKMPDTPIYVLTSSRTFSAAEEFTYNLKNMERATIVGETTGGGAHPVQGVLSNMGGGHYASLSIPFGRAINPITGTNWEGTGVTPDIEVPASDALEVAQLEALKALSEDEDDPQRRQAYAWARDGLEARLNPVTLDAAQAAAYVGRYGPRVVSLEDGQLTYRRGDGPVYRLIPMGRDRFRIDEIDFFRVEFVRDDAGNVVKLAGHYANGGRDGNERSD